MDSGNDRLDAHDQLCRDSKGTIMLSLDNATECCMFSSFMNACEGLSVNVTLEICLQLHELNEGYID